jgi:hypothetical protein
MPTAAGITVEHSPIIRVEAEGDQLRHIVFGDGTSIDRAGLFVHPAVHRAAAFAVPQSFSTTGTPAAAFRAAAP